MSRVIRCDDPEWPRLLDELHPHAPPSHLFAEGMALDPGAVHVAIVGTRRPTYSGLEVAGRISRGLAEAGFVVVSGMAVGIDAAAHRAALHAGGRTVAVLGCGLDVDYPARNAELKRVIAKRGTLITEYPDRTPPLKRYFPLRNRIIAGLSVGVVVIEGTIRSGALVTARLALDANRNVYAVPGSARNPMAEGPNELIRRGQAALVTGVEHVLEDLAPSLVWRDRGATEVAPELDEVEAAVLGALDDAPVAPDALAARFEFKPGRLSAALAALEVRGLARRGPGGYVRGSSHYS
ncbi:MAG: DNA-processing protein DprA [Actinomycetota bacterium]